MLPVNPTMLGRGNTVVAEPNAFGSFFYNPAGFGINDEFNLFSVSPWVFSDQATLGLILSPEQFGNEIEQELQSPDTQADIEAWFAGKTDAELATILSDAGYTEADVVAAGGTTSFFQNLPEEELIQVIGLVINEPDFPINAGQFNIPGGAARIGLNTGIYLINDDLGFGLFLTTEAQLEGDTIITASGGVISELSAHLGYALPVIDNNLLSLYAGFQIRPFYGIIAPLDVLSVQSLINGQDPLVLFNNTTGTRYIGLGFDVGFIASIWWFDFGLSAMNAVGAPVVTQAVLMSDATNDLGSLVSAPFNAERPKQLNFGIGFHPEISGLSWLVNPAFYADFQDIEGVITAAQEEDIDALKDLVSVGAEVELFNFLTARAGYTQGYYTIGAGADIAFVDINAAITTQAVDVADVSDFGFALDIGFRF